MSELHRFQGSLGAEDGGPCNYPLDADMLCGKPRNEYAVHLAFEVDATDPRYDEVARVYEKFLHYKRDEIFIEATRQTVLTMIYGRIAVRDADDRADTAPALTPD